MQTPSLSTALITLCEQGLVPDAATRQGMRQLLVQRLADEGNDDPVLRGQRFRKLLEDLRASPIAINTEDANAQHYEVPAAFFHKHLGPNLKYSCCYYPKGDETLAQAEEIMLNLYAERAELKDGQRMLDLGCGWGSLSLWLAKKFPNSEIVGLSNSHGQREFILARAAERGLKNLSVVTGNVAEFQFPAGGVAAGFDRVLSIEMMEHMKNYGALFEKIHGWMNPGAMMFVHIFTHRLLAYHFQDEGESDWMSRYFFTGGTMPSETLFSFFQDHLKLETLWTVSGTHYQKTAEQWLENLDAARAEVMPLLVKTYGGKLKARTWFNRWRMFYLAVSELFGYANGNEWGVTHYLFTRRDV